MTSKPRSAAQQLAVQRFLAKADRQSKRVRYTPELSKTPVKLRTAVQLPAQTYALWLDIDDSHYTRDSVVRSAWHEVGPVLLRRGFDRRSGQLYYSENQMLTEEACQAAMREAFDTLPHLREMVTAAQVLRLEAVDVLPSLRAGAQSKAEPGLVPV